MQPDVPPPPITASRFERLACAIPWRHGNVFARAVGTAEGEAAQVTHVLRGVSGVARTGEVVGVLGPSGERCLGCLEVEKQQLLIPVPLAGQWLARRPLPQRPVHTPGWPPGVL